MTSRNVYYQTLAWISHRYTYILECRGSRLVSPFDHFHFALIHGPDIPGSYEKLLFTALDLVSITSHIHNWILVLLWFHPFILSGVISPLISCSILDTYWPGEYFSVSYHFALSHCSWGSQGKNTEVVCHSLLQWTTFCQTSPPWPIPLGWPHMEWLSFIEPSWSTKESEMQYLDAISKTTEWSLFISKANYSISW